MPALRIDAVTLENFRCFEKVTIPLHRSLTVLYAENAGGKTAALNGLAVALGAGDDVARHIREGEVREVLEESSGTLVPKYPCKVTAKGCVAGAEIDWSRGVEHSGGRTTTKGSTDFRNKLRKLSADAEAPWPVIAFYGTERLSDMARATAGKVPKPGRRRDGYVDALDPRAKDEQLLRWLFDASLARLQGGATPTQNAFLDALRIAARHPTVSGEVKVRDVRFDMKRKVAVVELSTGELVPWDHLSDGYRVFLGLVADVARRCVTLNPKLGDRAVREAEGVVLVDEIDLSLHPTWQRVAANHLAEAFPKLQFVVSTHSPQVLSSVQNDQVVGLLPGQVVHPVRVAGRDSNSILRDVFGTTDRDQESPQTATLTRLYAALDAHDLDTATKLADELRGAWGPNDPEVVRVDHHLDWARDEKNSEKPAAD